MQKSHLFEFDPDIERTFHKLKKQRALLIASPSSMAGGGEAQRWTLRDYVTMGAHSQTPSITIPPVAANNFELKSALMSMKGKQMNDHHSFLNVEDPNLHLSVF